MNNNEKVVFTNVETKNGVNVTTIYTGIILFDKKETKKKYLKNFIKEFEKTWETIKHPMYVKINMKIKYNDKLELCQVSKIKVTKSNFKVTISSLKNDDGDVEYLELSFPIEIICSVSVEMF